MIFSVLWLLNDMLYLKADVIKPEVRKRQKT